MSFSVPLPPVHSFPWTPHFLAPNLPSSPMPPPSLGHLLTEAFSDLHTCPGESSSLLDALVGGDVEGGASMEPTTVSGPHLTDRRSYWHGDTSS